MLRLTQIELLGFKSFPHKTSVEIDRGVTCVVGPNGSGKSNIGDAIMFAFGSQSSRELRAHKTSGLIFAGTDKFRPLNHASVTLHFERTAAEMMAPADEFATLSPIADDEELDSFEIDAARPIGSQIGNASGYKGADLTAYYSTTEQVTVDRTPAVIKQLDGLEPGQTISVTRRIFRDGTGGYYINGEAVRLKDIDQFFDRFNLGRSSVFAVTQGEVEKKILSTPQEMREWLAEATGVALLLQQKSRAQSKLKRTQQNLSRLEDIRTSVREAVTDLADQRELAEAHQRFSAQLRSVELYEIRREVEFAQRQQESGAKGLEEVQARLSGLGAQLQGLRESASQMSAQKADAESGIAELEQTIAVYKEETAQLRQDSAVSVRAAEAAADGAGQAGADALELKGQIEVLQAELIEAESNTAKAAQEQSSAKEEEDKARDRLDECRRVLTEVAAQQEEVSGQIFNIAQRETTLKNEIVALEQTEQQYAKQLTSRRTQLETIQGQLTKAEAELEAEQENARQAKQNADAKRQQLESCTGSISAATSQLEELASQLEGLRAEQSGLISRRQAINEMTASNKQESGQAILLDNPELGPQMAMATELSFPEEYRPAFARLLADFDEAIICNRELLEGVHQTVKANAAEAQLVMASGRHPNLHQDSLWRKASAVGTVLASLIAALGDVLVADSLGEANALLVSENVSRVVLLDGSAVLTHSMATVGRPPQEKIQRVSRHSDLEQIEALLQEIGTELEQKGAASSELKKRLANSQWERDEIAVELAAAVERARHSQQLCERLAMQAAEKTNEMQEFALQTQQLSEASEKVSHDLPAAREGLREAITGRAELEEKANDIARRHMESGAAVEDSRQDLSRRTTARELAGQRVKHLRQTEFDLVERITNLRNKHSQVEERIRSLQVQQEQNATAAEFARKKAEELAAQTAEESSRLEALKAQLKALNESSGLQQSQIGDLTQEISRLEQDMLGLQNQRDRAMERISEWLSELEQRHGLTLSQLIADPAAASPPPGMEWDVSEAGRGKLREERGRLMAEIDKLGAVNLLAIEQHQEQSNKLAFLDKQAGELEKAVEGLLQLVVNLDRTTEKKYRQSLKKIEAKFNELYLRMFNSGWARLRFENPEEIINSGVEVEVQLPGNRRHSMRSLSGGQRSLIFLSLFFAVHTVRSPGFCILDEADAALDDANVERFVKLVREFASEEQFIIITHNKMTMETGDKLVGVVGRPKGISNLIEVDLRQARKMVDSSKGVA